MTPGVFWLCLATSVLAFGCGGTEENTNPQRFPAAWAVTGVSADQRTVNVSYEQGGCERKDPGVAVDEARNTVKIEVTEAAAERAPGVGCLASMTVGRLKARLHSPLRGRRIVGLREARFGGPPGPRHRHGSYFVRLVPRVAGLAVADAMLVLADYRFRPRTDGSRTGETVGTIPGPGAEGAQAWKPKRSVRILSKPPG